MKHKYKVGIVAALAVLSAIASAFIATGDDLRDGKALGEVAELGMTDQRGREFSLADLRGNNVLVSFVYPDCPMYCSAQTNYLHEAYMELTREVEAADFMFVSISLTPNTDTPATLRKFANRHHIDYDNWLFALAEPDITDALVDVFGVKVKVYDQFVVHTTDVFMLNRAGKFMGSVMGLPLDAEAVISSLAAVGS